MGKTVKRGEMFTVRKYEYISCISMTVFVIALIFVTGITAAFLLAGNYDANKWHPTSSCIVYPYDITPDLVVNLEVHVVSNVGYPFDGKAPLPNRFRIYDEAVNYFNVHYANASLSCYSKDKNVLISKPIMNKTILAFLIIFACIALISCTISLGAAGKIDCINNKERWRSLAAAEAKRKSSEEDGTSSASYEVSNVECKQ